MADQMPPGGMGDGHSKAMSEAQKVAIITGGSHGIGAGLVTAYRERGWAVVANSRTMKPSEDADLLAVDGDISEPGTAERITTASARTVRTYRHPRQQRWPLHLQAVHGLHGGGLSRAVGINLTGFFILTQHVIAAMLTGGGGHVVNITTTLVDYADARVPSVMTSLTKGGLASATKSLAIEYASRGIRVNAVSPGVIQTSVFEPETDDALGLLHPLGRVGQISDIVDGILFLESSPFITGEILHIDGGQIAGH